jgi:GDP/UDP-N,N'-diacetylbacillosamine 2-epimerase (hydrolysing)
MKLLFLTGSRGEWGYIRPILRLCQQRPDIEYSICATNMHLLPAYGQAVNEIRADGFEVHDQIYMALEGYNHFTMVKSLGLFLVSFTDVMVRVRPDWLILAGDRGEQLMGAICAGYTYIPTAHIQAGELSGNIDGTARHALGKFAHLHFASNEDAAQRLQRLGEEDFRIHMVGAPQLDELEQGLYTSTEALEKKYSIDLQRPYLLVVLHPVTEEYHHAADQAKALAEALADFDMPKIWILSNNDAGSDIIRHTIAKHRHGEIYSFANLKREDYLGFLKSAACIVGNSSSGLLEAPTFKVAAVNIGRRQKDRVQGTNVINTGFEVEGITCAIQRAISPEFQASLADCQNPYGDGHSSERILDILQRIPRNATLLAKQLTY